MGYLNLNIYHNTEEKIYCCFDFITTLKSKRKGSHSPGKHKSISSNFKPIKVLELNKIFKVHGKEILIKLALKVCCKLPKLCLSKSVIY